MKIPRVIFILPLFLIFCSYSDETNKSIAIKRKMEVVDFFKKEVDLILNQLSEVNKIFEIENTFIVINDLRKTFFEKTNISVSDNNLIDNRGSLVDVIGRPMNLILNYYSWKTFMKFDINVSLLIIHELLRVSGLDDDNYILSLPLYKKIKNDDMNEEKRSPYCNLKVLKFKKEIIEEDVDGVGHSNNGVGERKLTFNSMDQTPRNNAIDDVKRKCEIIFGDRDFEVIKLDGTQEMRSSGWFGFNKAESKYEMEARCIKEKFVERDEKEIRGEACRKVNDCYRLYDSESEFKIEDSYIDALEDMNKEYNCK